MDPGYLSWILDPFFPFPIPHLSSGLFKKEEGNKLQCYGSGTYILDPGPFFVAKN